MHVVIIYSTIHNLSRCFLAVFSGGLSQDFAGSGKNRVTAKNRAGVGSSHSTAHIITVAKFD